MEEKKLNEEYLKLYKQGKYEESLVLIEKILEINKSNPLHFCYMGCCLFSLGRYRGAIKCFDKAINLNDKEAMYYSNKGISFNKLEEYDEAHKWLEISL